MKLFIGTKIVKAEPMNLYEFSMNIKGEDCKEENQEGFMVGYSDANGNFDGPLKEGCHYISWSPQDVFEAAYAQQDNLTFGIALEAMKWGDKVARPGWNGSGMHLEVQMSDENSKMTHPYLFMTIPGCEEGTRVLPWQPAQVDIFATDWMIV